MSGTLYLSSGDTLDSVHYLKVQIFFCGGVKGGNFWGE